MTRTGRGLLGAALALTLALTLGAGCGGSSAAAGTPPPGAVVLTAQNELFVPNSISAPAGEAFVLYFDNRDTSLHNAHLVDASGATIIPGELFNGPSARIENVPALTAGTYKILCDVHPNMFGELIAN
ncbi:MAG: cupredoxin domain-containing protein [Chloroflexota bacterium]